MIRFLCLLLFLSSFVSAAVPPASIAGCAELGFLPPGCPETIGGDCPRCYINHAANYTPGAPLTLSAAAKYSMASLHQQYVDLMFTHRPPTYVDSPTTFSGTAGRALLCLKLWRRTGNSTYLTAASEYMTASLARLENQIEADKQSQMTGFFWSATGIPCVAAVLASELKNETAMQHYLDVANELIFRPAHWGDFDSGAAGGLFAVRFLAANLPASTVFPWTQDDVTQLAHTAIALGVQHDSGKPYLQYVSPEDGKSWLGTSHGSAGVMHELIQVPGLLENGTAYGLIEATLDHTVSVQFTDGNYPEEYEASNASVLVQWDHGAGGVGPTMALAGKAMNKPAYTASAQAAMGVVWRRGLLTKGLQACHGITGNVYALLQVYQTTGNPEYMYNAVQMLEFVVTQPTVSNPAQMRAVKPDPWVFWEGSFEASILLWTDILYTLDPMDYSFTGFQAAIAP